MVEDKRDCKKGMICRKPDDIKVFTCKIKGNEDINSSKKKRKVSEKEAVLPVSSKTNSKRRICKMKINGQVFENNYEECNEDEDYTEMKTPWINVKEWRSECLENYKTCVKHVKSHRDYEKNKLTKPKSTESPKVKVTTIKNQET